MAWSGRRVYDVGREDQRLVLYALLLAEAQQEDLGPHARREWERQLITTASR